MKKDEYISKYGLVAYNNKLKQNRVWCKTNLERRRETKRVWNINNIELVKEQQQKRDREQHRKGGKYNEKKLIKEHSGLRGNRGKVRMRDGYKWRPYKRIIAPDSQIHHQWLPGTAKYTGLALVEKDQHQQGFIDVIQILEGEITHYSEEEVRRGNEV